MGRVLHTTDVVEILLADEWHRVANGSFSFESVELAGRDGRAPMLLETPGQGFPGTSACWREPSGIALMCPLTSVLAIKLAPENGAR